MATLRLTGVSGMLPMAMSGVKAKRGEEQWHMKRAKKEKEAYSTQVTSTHYLCPSVFLKPYRYCL